MNTFDMSNLTGKLQQLQSQVEQFNQMQAQGVNQPTQMPTYPKVVRSDTVEDILNNPQWRQELEAEFSTSEFGTRAKNYTDVLFREFCENQTGKPSTMLENLRKEAKAKPTKTKAKNEEGSET